MSSIDRKPHCLHREKSLAIPREVFIFDTETWQTSTPDGSVKQLLRLGWVVYYRRAYGRHLPVEDWLEFKDSLSFWQFVYRRTGPKKRLWIMSRNLVFDFTIVEGWKYLRPVGFKLKFFHTSGSTNIISVKGRYGSLLFVDVLNWFKESLRDTGERIGIPKLNIDFATCNESELSNYCKRDLLIELENFKGFIRFLTGNSISRLCYTIGSTAMSAYLFGHYKTPIYIHNNREAVDLERDSYRGGRVECFYIGQLTDGPYHILDVNSLYPYVMKTNLYPVKYKRILHDVTVKRLSNYLDRYACIAKVLIETNEPVYAVRRDKTIFPVGFFWVTLCTSELKYALQAGHIRTVKDLVLYEQADIFSSYVDRFYTLRQDFKSAGVGQYEHICKLLLNSLYGKFGQRGEVWKKIGDCPDEPDRIELLIIDDLGRRRQLRYLLGEVFVLDSYKECFDSFPAIASHVTANGRLHLFDLMKKAGVGNFFYCDTDSLIVNTEGLCRLQDRLNPTSLGGIKTVETTVHLTIRGLKDYSTETKQVIKGVSKNAEVLGDGVFRQDLWPSFRSVLREPQSDTYTVKKTTKYLNRKYSKGKLSLDGSVVPLVLDESMQSELFLP